MKYISEERLREIARQTHDSDDTNHIVLSIFDYLINECQELNQWQPIESAPKDRHVLLHVSVGPINCRNFVGNAYDSWPWKPTHWMELPPAPELPEPPK